MKRKRLLIGGVAILCGTVILGGTMYYRSLYKMPLKEYTAGCLYLAVMDDEISRNELENVSINGTQIVFPPKRESLQQKYHTFLELNQGITPKEMNKLIKTTEARLEESKQYLEQKATDLTMGDASEVQQQDSLPHEDTSAMSVLDELLPHAAAFCNAKAGEFTKQTTKGTGYYYELTKEDCFYCFELDTNQRQSDEWCCKLTKHSFDDGAETLVVKLSVAG